MIMLLKKPAWLLSRTTKAASQLKIGRVCDCPVAVPGLGLDPGEPEPCAAAKCCVSGRPRPERCPASTRQGSGDSWICWAARPLGETQQP